MEVVYVDMFVGLCTFVNFLISMLMACAVVVFVNIVCFCQLLLYGMSTFVCALASDSPLLVTAVFVKKKSLILSYVYVLP